MIWILLRKIEGWAVDVHYPLRRIRSDGLWAKWIWLHPLRLFILWHWIIRTLQLSQILRILTPINRFLAPHWLLQIHRAWHWISRSDHWLVLNGPVIILYILPTSPESHGTLQKFFDVDGWTILLLHMLRLIDHWLIHSWLFHDSWWRKCLSHLAE